MKNKIFFDCEGVYTNDSFWISSSGEISKGFCTKDVRATRELIANGYEVYIITASTWPGIHNFCKKTGAEVIIERDKSKIDVSDCIVVVNDSWDIPLLKNSCKVFLPNDFNKRDLEPHLKRFEECDIIICKRIGGQGVVDEILKYLI